MSDVEDIEASVLLTTFTSKKKRYKVYFHQNQVIWDREKPPHSQVTVRMEDVITVKHIYRNPPHPLDDPIIDPTTFIIHYVKRGPKNVLKYANIMFRHADPMQVSSWVKTLQNHIQGYRRPKNLLMFVNPYGGHRKALKIYEKMARPLFQMAGLDVTLNISQRKDQIRDYLCNHSLDIFDAVACVGGDGTFAEVFNGLVLRECQKRNLDFHDINAELPKPSLPIGLIPGGSTNSTIFCLHGTADITTSVLYIILGDRLGLDLVSVYDETTLLNLYSNQYSYGYLGDVIHHSDKFRWLGPRRYDFSGFKALVANNGYHGEIALLMDKTSNLSKCYEKCEECAMKRDVEKDADLVWRTLSGKYFLVSSANISCACDKAPNGLAPYCHLGDGNVHVILVKHTSFFNNIRLLLRISNKKKLIYDLPFVEVYKAREFCFRSINKKGKWNCDGEVQLKTDIRAKVRNQIISVFGRGPPVPPEEPSKSCSLCCV